MLSFRTIRLFKLGNFYVFQGIISFTLLNLFFCSNVLKQGLVKTARNQAAELIKYVKTD